MVQVPKESESRKEKVKKAIYGSFRMAERNSINQPVHLRYPSILKDNIQEKIAERASYDTNVGISEFTRKPLYMCASFMNMYDKNMIRFPATNGTKRKSIIYTDASVRDNKSTTISFVVLNDDKDLLFAYASKIENYTKPVIAEMKAGIKALETVKSTSSLNKSVRYEWFCDNDNVVESFRGSSLGKDTEQFKSDIKEIKSNFKNISYKNLKGDRNRLADALCDDVRLGVFGGYITYRPTQTKDF